MGVSPAISAAIPRPAAPVVLVGGVLQRPATWNSWVDELSALGVPHAIADVPRAGLATRQAYTDAIDGARLALLREQGLAADTPVSLVGFSAGGVGSVDYLRLHPGQVDRVVTVSSPLKGNWLASVLAPVTPQGTWFRDLAVNRAVLDDLPPSLDSRVTSIVGAPIDGIVTRRSGTSPRIEVVQADDVRFHPLMQERNAGVRHDAWAALSEG